VRSRKYNFPGKSPEALLFPVVLVIVGSKLGHREAPYVNIDDEALCFCYIREKNMHSSHLRSPHQEDFNDKEDMIAFFRFWKKNMHS
jgi:hypothetical protein